MILKKGTRGNEVKLLQEVHFGPLQVLINDKHTFPSTYKLGLNLVLLLHVQNLTFGGANG